MRAAVLLMALFAFAPRSVQAADCAQFADPLAYNACLARQGPAARAVHMSGKPDFHAPPRVARRVAPAGRRGRAEMVFSVRK